MDNPSVNGWEMMRTGGTGVPPKILGNLYRHITLIWVLEGTLGKTMAVPRCPGWTLGTLGICESNTRKYVCMYVLYDLCIYIYIHMCVCVSIYIYIHIASTYSYYVCISYIYYIIIYISKRKLIVCINVRMWSNVCISNPMHRRYMFVNPDTFEW